MATLTSVSNYIVDTCATVEPTPVFTVDLNEAHHLFVTGDVAGLTLPVLQRTYNGTTDIYGEAPLAINGVAVAVGEGYTSVLIAAPGIYSVDASSVPAGTCVQVRTTKMSLEDALVIAQLQAAGAATTTTTPTPTVPVANTVYDGVPAGIPAAVTADTPGVQLNLDLSGGDYDASALAVAGLADGATVRLRKTDTTGNRITYTDASGVTYSFVDQATEFITLQWFEATGTFSVI